MKRCLLIRGDHIKEKNVADVMVVPVALCGFVDLVSRTGSLGLVVNESDPYLEFRVWLVHVKECY